MSKTTDVLRVIVFKAGDVWVGQGLELDIHAEGPDLNILKSRFLATLRAELAGGDPARIGPAPERYQKLWAERSDFTDRANVDNGLPVELALAA